MRARSPRRSGVRAGACVAGLVLAAAVLGACARNDTLFSPLSRLAFGTWGGDRAQVVAGDSLTQVWVNCAWGDFPGDIPLDASGRFSVNGNWTASFGPIRIGGAMPAQLSGQVTGRTLTFAIAVYDTVAMQVSSVGPQAVVFGRPGGIVVCPV